jgi:hypothetical protein
MGYVVDREEWQIHTDLAERFVAEGLAQIERQRRLIQELERNGGDATRTRAFLTTLLESQLRYERHRDRLRQEAGLDLQSQKARSLSQVSVELCRAASVGGLMGDSILKLDGLVHSCRFARHAYQRLSVLQQGGSMSCVLCVLGLPNQLRRLGAVLHFGLHVLPRHYYCRRERNHLSATGAWGIAACR